MVFECDTLPCTERSEMWARSHRLTLHQGYLGANLERGGDNSALEAVRKPLSKALLTMKGIELNTVEDLIGQVPPAPFYTKVGARLGPPSG